MRCTVRPNLEDDIPINYLSSFITSQEKFRMVYNAALKVGLHSLNDLLFRGPMFIAALADILMRFREYEYAITGDIKSMFFQIRIAPQDRDMLRIIFYNNQTSSYDHYRFKVAPFGLKCIPSMAGFCIHYTADRNIPKVAPKVAKTLKSSMYVDDPCKCQK